MPKDFEEMKSKIASKLKGKTNPKTNKSYTDSDIYAIATAAYKKKTGNVPSHGKEFYKPSLFSLLSYKEDDKDFYVKGYVATSHPDRAISQDKDLDIEYDGDIIPKDTLHKIADSINNKFLPQAGAVSERHDWIYEGNSALPLAGVIASPAKVVQLEDGEFGVETEVVVNKLHPRYNDIKYSVEKGIYPGFSIEYETNDYSVIEKEGKLYRNLDDINMEGFAFASRRLIANPHALINEQSLKEIEIKELIYDPILLENKEEMTMEECPKCKKKMQKDKMKSHMNEEHNETMEKEIKQEVNKMETNIQTSAPVEVKQPEVSSKETSIKLDEAKIKELVELKIKEQVALQVKEVFEASKPIMDSGSSSTEIKETRDYREAFEKGSLSFKEANSMINRFPIIFQKTFAGNYDIMPNKKWETELKAAPGMDPTFIDVYRPSMAKINVKEVEMKAALAAFNSPTNAEATYYQAPAELGDFYNPVIISHLNDATTLFGILPKEDWSDRQNIQFRVVTSDPTAAGYLEGDSTWTSTNVTRLKLEQDYANYRVIVEVTGQMMQAASGRGGIGDVWGQEVERATVRLRKQINTDILTGAAGTYNGTDARYVLGLQHLILTTGNLYGKARGTYSTLQGQTTAASSAKITLDILRIMIQNVLTKGADRRNLVVVTSYTQERFIRGIYQKMQIAAPTVSAFGFGELLSIDGVPIFPDQNANGGDCFLLDLSHLKATIFQAPTLTEFGITGDTRKAFIKMYFQVYNDKPENIYAYTGLATS